MSNDLTFILRIPVTDDRAVFYETHKVKHKPFRHDGRLCLVTESRLVGNQVNFTISQLPRLW